MAIARYPVTFGEYAEFLDALGDEEAKERCPHTQNETFMQRGEDGRFRPLHVIVEGEAHERCVERHGSDYLSRIPVIGISWDDAVAYCEWQAKTTNQEWRLPTEQEREKAARGVDGRTFAWGDLADASLGKCSDSRPENTQPEPIGAFPTAESVYGMGDASGGVWDWTDSWFDERRSLRVLRGGSWLNIVAALRCADRSRSAPRTRVTGIGFRCARDL